MDLAEQIEASSSSAPVSTTLRTDERVLARVTDGIYRQPGSAIRELVSNAYDADATRVTIQTDRPRFNSILVEDNGIGMSPAALAHLVHHIGGSAKRSEFGGDLNVTSKDDSQLSPGGRQLIGKIGIGLFSVSQLTQSFQIITKVKGDSFRTVATVVLKQYSDEAVEPDDKYEAGLVEIWREPAADIDRQGTSIILTAIRPQSRETLQSNDIWEGIEANEALEVHAERQELVPPVFHIGRSTRGDSSLLRSTGTDVQAVPWNSKTDSGAAAFRKLVDAVWAQVDQGIPNPKLDRIFDYYLQMAWQLSLAVPLPYYDANPLDLAFGDSAYLYRLPQNFNAVPEEISLAPGETLRDELGLGEDSSTPDDFTVLLDDLELARPLRFQNLPTGDNSVKKPIIFAGSCSESFEGVPIELSGGPLEFRAYLMWTPKVVPTEHQGALLRIHGASGTVFDPTFLRYQISEQNRLRQTTCEILVTKGLDSALNIDRESFNFAHPHVVYVTKWLHSALRRLATTQKGIAADLLKDKRDVAAKSGGRKLERIVKKAWEEATDDDASVPPPVDFPDARTNSETEAGGYSFDRKEVFGSRPKGGRRQRSLNERLELRVQAIAQVLAAYQVLDELSPGAQVALLRAIREIVETEF